MSEWLKRDLTFPNPSYNCVQVYIAFAHGIGASYYPVEGGFKLDRNRANAKLYTSEQEIRTVLLKRLLTQVRKLEQEISAALNKANPPRHIRIMENITRASGAKSAEGDTDAALC